MALILREELVVPLGVAPRPPAGTSPPSVADDPSAGRPSGEFM